jgi:sigma-B regulation protein RsbU (phosphoserine phosphatase)
MRIIKIYTSLGFLASLISMTWNFLKDESILIRLQSKMIFMGMILALLIPTIELIFRSIWPEYHFPGPDLTFPVLFIFFPLSIAYTIVKYDLFAIDAIIKRTYGYVLTTGVIAGVYGLFVFISNLAFGEFEFTKSPLFPLIFILVVVFLFNPIRNRVQKFIDRIFYRLEYDYQETIQKISESLRSLLSLDQIGQRMIENSVGVMFIDSGSVMVLDPEEKFYESLTPSHSTLALSANDPLIQKIAGEKKEVTQYDIQQNPIYEKDKEACRKTFDQLKATLLVPLIYEDRMTGLISLGNKKSGKFYRREDINLLKILANQGAVAIENARLFQENLEKQRMEEELNIARDLQMSMLPAICPQVEGFTITATSIPAREVGGDFFDFIEMGEDKLGLVVGDVTGKSVSGALVMSASRSVFRMLSEEQLTVGDIMIRANKRIKKDIKSGMFVALLYAVLDGRNKILKFCSAGQTQPVYYFSKTGEARLKETLGDRFPLGILDGSDYRETRLELASGDRIVFYTDGIVEAMNEKEEIFGFERLLKVVQESRSMNADSLLKEILDKVRGFSGGAPQNDDLTVIVVAVN